MDNGTMVTVVILIAITGFAILLANFNRKKYEKRMLKKIADFAAIHQSTLNESEYWGKSGIGIDEQKSVLVFLQDLNDTTTAECIKLSDIERCKTVNQGRDVNGIGKVIDKLQLVMYPYGHKGEIVLEFYNAEVSMQLHDELLIIEKWAKKINAHLS